MCEDRGGALGVTTPPVPLSLLRLGGAASPAGHGSGRS